MTTINLGARPDEVEKGGKFDPKYLSHAEIRLRKESDRSMQDADEARWKRDRLERALEHVTGEKHHRAFESHRRMTENIDHHNGRMNAFANAAHKIRAGGSLDDAASEADRYGDGYGDEVKFHAMRAMMDAQKREASAPTGGDTSKSLSPRAARESLAALTDGEKVLWSHGGSLNVASRDEANKALLASEDQETPSVVLGDEAAVADTASKSWTDADTAAFGAGYDGLKKKAELQSEIAENVSESANAGKLPHSMAERTHDAAAMLHREAHNMLVGGRASGAAKAHKKAYDHHSMMAYRHNEAALNNRDFGGHHTTYGYDSRDAASNEPDWRPRGDRAEKAFQSTYTTQNDRDLADADALQASDSAKDKEGHSRAALANNRASVMHWNAYMHEGDPTVKARHAAAYIKHKERAVHHANIVDPDGYTEERDLPERMGATAKDLGGEDRVSRVRARYDELRQKTPRDVFEIWGRSHRVGGSAEYNPQEHRKAVLISDILRDEHGHAAVDAAFKSLDARGLDIAEKGGGRGTSAWASSDLRHTALGHEREAKIHRNGYLSTGDKGSRVKAIRAHRDAADAWRKAADVYDEGEHGKRTHLLNAYVNDKHADWLESQGSGK
jgi:hypothetical protein